MRSASFDRWLSGHRERWTLGAVLGLLAVLGVLLVTFGWLLGPLDLLTFLKAGERVVDGQSPYDSVTSSVFQVGHAFVYPTFVAWVFAPLSLLPHHLAEAVYIGGSAAAIIIGCSLLGRRGIFPAALVLVSSTTIIGLQMGTVNAYLFLGLACAWRYRTSRPAVSGIMLGLVAATKLFLLPIVAWPLLMRRYSTTGVSLVTFAALVVASAVFGPVSAMSYLHLLSKLQGNEAIQSWSLTSFFESAGLGSSLAAMASILVAVGLLVAVRVRLARFSDGQLLGAVVLCSLLVSPIVWSSYLLLLAVPLLIASSDNRDLAVLALASWALVTPDLATPAGISLGISLTVVMSYLATRSKLPDIRRSLLSQPPRRLAVALAGAGTLTAALALVPPTVRNAMPALLCVCFVAASALGSRSVASDLPGLAAAT